MPTRSAAHAASFMAALLLAACGGGSEGGGEDIPAAVVAPASAAPVAASTCGINDFAATALVRMNQLRAAGADCRSGGRFAPAGALAWNTLLTQAAERHSQDMAARNFFDHVGSDGSTLSVRVDATGYSWRGLGENIGAGYAGIDEAMARWMASDSHCANLMNPRFIAVGLACVPGTAATNYSSYWTMDLAWSP